MKKILWFILILVTTATLLLGIFSRSWIITAIAVVLCLLLKKVNRLIDIPDFYKKYGITAELFEHGISNGDQKYEKNN